MKAASLAEEQVTNEITGGAIAGALDNSGKVKVEAMSLQQKTPAASSDIADLIESTVDSKPADGKPDSKVTEEVAKVINEAIMSRSVNKAVQETMSPAKNETAPEPEKKVELYSHAADALKGQILQSTISSSAFLDGSINQEIAEQHSKIIAM